MRKRLVLLAFLSSLLFAICFVSADTYNYFFEDSFVKEQEKLDVKSNLLVDSFTGAAVYTYPLDLPPGTNDLKPNINLIYNSHSTGENPGILGKGWDISSSYVQRDTNN